VDGWQTFGRRLLNSTRVVGYLTIQLRIRISPRRTNKRKIENGPGNGGAKKSAVGRFGTASTATIFAGSQVVESGGIASATTVSSSGVLEVLSGGTAINAIVSSGGAIELFGGAITSGTAIGGGGILIAGSGYTVSGLSGAIVNGSGVEYVASGGTANGVTVNSGGQENLAAGAAASASIINSGGVQLVAGTATRNPDESASGVNV
jgi:autotransporter passenger strand-loop-strand repeat protein